MRNQLFFGEAHFEYPRNFRDVWIPGGRHNPIPIKVLHGEKNQGVETRDILLTIHGVPTVDPVSDEVIGWGLTGWGTSLTVLRVGFSVPRGEDSFLEMTVRPCYLRVLQGLSVPRLKQYQGSGESFAFHTCTQHGSVYSLSAHIREVDGCDDRISRLEGSTAFPHYLTGASAASLAVSIWDIGRGKPNHIMRLAVPAPLPLPTLRPKLQLSQPAPSTQEDHAHLVTVMQQYVGTQARELWTMPYEDAFWRAQAVLMDADFTPAQLFAAYGIPQP